MGALVLLRGNVDAGSGSLGQKVPSQYEIPTPERKTNYLPLAQAPEERYVCI
jgi:hypothetical protein